MSNDRATYSQIIGPAVFNEMMTEQHLYIKEADDIIENLIRRKARKGAEVVELGCGPGRLMQRIAKLRIIALTAIDHDQAFLDHAETLLWTRTLRQRVNIIHADIVAYKLPKPVDVFYSQGVHHHIPKGELTAKYLKNVFDQFAPGGCYIVSDEFLAPYDGWLDRQITTVMWHSHIIAAALAEGYRQLAIEEAKTLIDDLKATDVDWRKSDEQIELVLDQAPMIEELFKRADGTCKFLAEQFLEELDRLVAESSEDPRLDLSRGDYKICGWEFRGEVTSVGFEIESVQHLGPIDVAGGFSIYILRKPK